MLRKANVLEVEAMDFNYLDLNKLKLATNPEMYNYKVGMLQCKTDNELLTDLILKTYPK